MSPDYLVGAEQITPGAGRTRRFRGAKIWDVEKAMQRPESGRPDTLHLLVRGVRSLAAFAANGSDALAPISLHVRRRSPIVFTQPVDRLLRLLNAKPYRGAAAMPTATILAPKFYDLSAL